MPYANLASDISVRETVKKNDKDFFDVCAIINHLDNIGFPVFVCLRYVLPKLFVFHDVGHS